MQLQKNYRITGLTMQLQIYKDLGAEYALANRLKMQLQIYIRAQD